MIIAFKCLIQQTWVEGVSLDEFPDSISSQWILLREGLRDLNGLEIPRCVIPIELHSKQLHVFCDASERGYAAVVYVRNRNCHGKVKANLLTAKTRVAPVKQLSMPRLELCAAKVGANLLRQISQALSMDG